MDNKEPSSGSTIYPLVIHLVTEVSCLRFCTPAAVVNPASVVNAGNQLEECQRQFMNPNRRTSGRPPLLNEKAIADMPTPSIVVVNALDENDRGTEFLEELLPRYSRRPACRHQVPCNKSTIPRNCQTMQAPRDRYFQCVKRHMWEAEYGRLPRTLISDCFRCFCVRLRW